MIGVSQTIDAWSFGCVLSVAATWIVLGFSGILQYERLRQLSPANQKRGQRLDRFHDGYQVLPEVGKWHDYLRGHLRPSDTTTEQVLDLIEIKLLRAEPVARHTLEELCEKLQELSDWAQYKIRSLRKYSRDIDPLVMGALSSIEEKAHTRRVSERNLTRSQQSLVSPNPRQRASMRTNMEDIIRNKPLGQTAHRRQILEENLKLCFGEEEDKAALLAEGLHNGGLTDSPTDATFPKDLQLAGRKINPKNPQLRAHGQEQSDTDIRTLSGARPFLESDRPATPPPSSDRHAKVSNPGTGPYDDDSFTTYSHGIPFEISPSTRADTAGRNPKFPEAGSPPEKHHKSLAQPNVTSELIPPPADKENAMRNPALLAGKETCAEESPRPAPSHIVIERDNEYSNVASTHRPAHNRSHRGNALRMSDMSPMNSTLDYKPIYELNLGTASLVGAVRNLGPSITVSQAEVAQFSQLQSASSDSTAHTHRKQAIHTPESLRSHDDSPLPLPPSALDLPYDICLKRKSLDHQVSKGIAKGIAKMKGTLGLEARARATSLVETFSDPRELVSSLKKLLVLG